MASSTPPKLDERWQAKYRAKYNQLCSTITTSDSATTTSSASDAALSPAPTPTATDTATTTATPTTEDSTASTSQPAPPNRTEQLTAQMHAYITAEVRAALARLRHHGPLSPIRWLLGALAATTSFQNPLAFTGMSLLFHASRAAEALGFDSLDHVLPYIKVGQDWTGATIQHLVMPPGLALAHSICTPVFELLHRFDDPLVVNALFKGFGLGVVAARHVLDGLIARRSVRHVLQLVEEAAVERHMEWVQAQLVAGPSAGVLATVRETPQGLVATAGSS